MIERHYPAFYSALLAKKPSRFVDLAHWGFEEVDKACSPIDITPVATIVPNFGIRELRDESRNSQQPV